MSDLSRDPGRPVVISTDDGTVFLCEPVEVGGLVRPRETRWRFTDADGVQYVGPPYRPGTSLAELQLLVRAWWASKNQRD